MILSYLFMSYPIWISFGANKHQANMIKNAWNHDVIMSCSPHCHKSIAPRLLIHKSTSWIFVV